MLENAKVLVAGAGAVGCEFLKNISTMGVATGGGLITSVDFDTVSQSNLSRQFLFSAEDVQKNRYKSEAASIRIKSLNPDINIVPQTIGVSSGTEDVYDHRFWSELNCIASAVDSNNARKYLNRKAHQYSIPMVEGGTNGNASSSVTVIPGVTAPYTEYHRIAQEKFCAPKGLMFKQSHTVAAAVSDFDTIFFTLPLYVQHRDKMTEEEKKVYEWIEDWTSNEALCSGIENKNDVAGKILFESLFYERVLKGLNSDVDLTDQSKFFVVCF